MPAARFLGLFLLRSRQTSITSARNRLITKRVLQKEYKECVNPGKNQAAIVMISDLRIVRVDPIVVLRAVTILSVARIAVLTVVKMVSDVVMRATVAAIAAAMTEKAVSAVAVMTFPINISESAPVPEPALRWQAAEMSSAVKVLRAETL